jgi:hypothetical protein
LPATVAAWAAEEIAACVLVVGLKASIQFPPRVRSGGFILPVYTLNVKKVEPVPLKRAVRA